jgi:hypothetical protein
VSRGHESRKLSSQTEHGRTIPAVSGALILLVYLAAGVLHAVFILRLRHVRLTAPIPDDLSKRQRERLDKFRARNLPGMMTTMNVILAVFLAIVAWPLGFVVSQPVRDMRTAVTGRIAS